MSVTPVTARSHVTELAAGLLDPNRNQPWGVVSIPETGDKPLIDIQHLHDEVGDVCRIHTIKTGALTRALESLLPARCQVYGGASRIYLVGDEWHTQPEASPLRFVHNPNQGAKVTQQLVHDALRMAANAGLFSKPRPTAILARGVVQKLVADNTRALVKLDNEQYATIVHELTYPNIPFEWIIHEGQNIEGLLDPDTKRLTPTLRQPSLAELLEHYPHGTVTLAYVTTVDRQAADLAIHPTHICTVNKQHISSNPHDRADLLLAPGDVVPVRVIRDEQGRLALRLNDIDDDENLAPAVTLTPGGEPWLVHERHQIDDDGDIDTGQPGHDQSQHSTPSDAAAAAHIEHATEPQTEHGTELLTEPQAETLTETLTDQPAPRPSPGPYRITQTAPTAIPTKLSDTDHDPQPAVKGATALQTAQLALEAARRENLQLKKELKRTATQNHGADTTALELTETLAHNRGLRTELKAARDEQRTQRTMLRSLGKLAEKNSYAGRRARFDDDDEWMRHEVHLAWINRLTPEDRRQHPLPEYLTGDRFTASLDSFDDATKDKALKCVVDVLTGRARDIASRAVHPLRTGDGANAAALVRDDNARCMRAYIEQNVASARRLHYWVHGDGRIELSRIVTHDDMDP